MSDWADGEFVAGEMAAPGVATFVSVAGDGGAAMPASLPAEPVGPDCAVFISKLCAVGTVTGCGCDGGSVGPDGIAVADGISICTGLGTVIWRRAGSGTTVAVAAVGVFVSSDDSRIVTGGAGKVGLVPSCPPKTAGTKLAISQARASTRVVITRPIT